MERPRLKAHYTAEVVDGSKVFLLAEDGNFLIQGTAAVRVLPYLDGRHSTVDIATALAGVVPLPELFLALRKFEIAGHLADGRPDLPDGVLAYWDALGADPATSTARHAACRPAVYALGDVDPAPVLTAMAGAGVPATLVDDPLGNRGGEVTGHATAVHATPVVVLVDDYLHPDLAALNAALLAGRRRWLIAKPAGMELWCGPAFDPAATGCWACLAQRVSANRQVEQYVLGKRGSLDGAWSLRYPTTVAGPTLLGGLLAQELVGMAAGAGPSAARLVGTLVTLDTRNLETAEHTLVRQPQCPACGDPTLVTGRPAKVFLNGAQQAEFTVEGGYRVEPPARTYERLKHHVSPILGAVSSLTRHEGPDNGVTHSYSAGHNFAMVGDSMALLRRNLRGQSGGKGRTDLQARVSALCEAIERYSGVWRGDEPVTRSSYAALAAGTAVHPEELLLFSDAQRAARGDGWNADPANRLHLVPDPLPDDLPIDWSTAWSLACERERLVPSAYAWFGHPDLDRCFFCYGDSNGNAAGNTIEEAILQGFCELVERDAVAIWWYNRLPCPEFDLDTLDDPYIEVLRRFYAGMDRSLHVLDISTDLPVPVFAAVSRRTGHAVEDILVGFGSHLDPAIAVNRALSEVNQFLPAVERRDENGNTIYLEDDVATLAWWREATMAEEPWLLPAPGTRARSLPDYPRPPVTDLAAAVRQCVRSARDAGLDVLVLDQTRPDLALPVVKVMVPGLRHFWRRLGPGRLYDVPVRTGRLAAPRAEAEMNPRSVFF